MLETWPDERPEQLLGSAYALGADSEQLTQTYEHEITTLVSIDERFVRGDKIEETSWRDFLAQKPWVALFPRRNGRIDILFI